MSKQNIFIQQMIIQSSSQIEEEAQLEWVIQNIVDYGVCLCQKTNPYYYQLFNKMNKNIILVGADCLKYLPHLKPVATVLYKQYHYKITSKTPEKRPCHHCLKHSIGADDLDFKTICKACWIKGIREVTQIPLLGYQLCHDCFTLSIKPHETKTKCLACYKKSSQWRACTVCQKLVINADKPDYVDKCHPCYLHYKETLKNQEMRECQQCHQMVIPTTEASFKTCCHSCYRQNKLIEKDQICSQNNLNLLKSILNK